MRQSKLWLNGEGQSKLKLSGNGNECKPLPRNRTRCSLSGWPVLRRPLMIPARAMHAVPWMESPVDHLGGGVFIKRWYRGLMIEANRY